MTISDQVIAVLDNLCTKFGIAIDWTSENVLPYVMELAGKFIKYEIATSVITCVLILVFFFPALKFCVWALKKYFSTDRYDVIMEIISVVATIAFVIIAVVAIIGIPMEIFDIATCLTFPEKAIFEYVSYMMKSA